jgi:hypothetical protein
MKTSSLTIRLITLLLILIASHFAFAIIYSATPHNVHPLATDLNDMPLTFGDWTCVSTSKWSDGVKDPAGATFSINRVYASSDKRWEVLAYVAVWTEYRGGFMVHPPPICYAAAGHEILATTETKFGPTANTMLMSTRLEGRPTTVLYWYQLGPYCFHDATGMQATRWQWSYMGQKSWPPLVKVMLEIRGTDKTNAERLLVNLGEKLLAWNSTEL